MKFDRHVIMNDPKEHFKSRLSSNSKTPRQHTSTSFSVYPEVAQKRMIEIGAPFGNNLRARSQLRNQAYQELFTAQIG